MSKSAVGWLLIVLGAIGTAAFFIKMTIIGYYPNEAVGFFVLVAVSLAAMWVGDRFRRQAKIDAEDPRG